MASVSIVFRNDKLNLQNSAPVHLRIIKNRKINYISTGVTLPKKFWDEENKKVKKGFKNANRLNSFLANKFTELQDQVFEQETLNKSLSTSRLKEKIYGKKPVDFFSFAKDVIQKYYQAGMIGTGDRSKSIITKLENYCNGKELQFQDINMQFLNNYETYLRTKLDNTTNTVHNNLKFIRKLFNDAYRLDLIEYHENPFLKYKIRTEKTERSFLTEQQLERIENLQLDQNTRMALHRDMFVFASYCGGLRVSDVLQLQWKNFDGMHIHFTIKKTRQQLSIKLPKKAIQIIELRKLLRQNPNSFIFPMLPDGMDLTDPRLLDKEITSATAYINKNLKFIGAKAEIEKSISFHVSRHTWATRALTKGMSIDKVSKLMGHAAIRETQIYAKIINQELDKAMDVFDK
jgi:integrase/recombinase XerD